MKQSKSFGRTVAALLIFLFTCTSAALAQVGDTYVCANTLTTYTVPRNDAYNILWTATGGTISGANNNQSVQVRWSSAAGPKEIKVTYTFYMDDPLDPQPLPSAGPSAGNVDFEPVTITTQKAVYLVSGGALSNTQTQSNCMAVQGTLTLSGQTGTIAWWESSNDGAEWGMISNTSATYSYAVSESSYFRVAVRNSNNSCVTYSSPEFIYMEQSPSVPLMTGATRCGTGTVTLGASGAWGGQTYAWYTNAGTSLNVTSATYTPTVSTTTTFRVAIVNSNGCEGTRAPVTATVTSPPTAPAAPAKSRCGPGTVTLTASGAPSGGSYRWYTAAGALIPGATASSYTTPSISTTTNYGVSVVNATGCESNKTTVAATITVTPGPTVPGSSLCKSATVMLTASGAPAGVTYRWYNVASGGTPLYQSTVNEFAVFVHTTSTYHVSFVNGTCESTRTPVTVTVNTAPPAPLAAGGMRCGPGAFTLTATGAGAGQSYRWYSTGGSVVATTQNYTTPSLTSSASYYVSIVNTSSGCESEKVMVGATIDPACGTPGGNYITTNTILKSGVTATTQIAALPAEDLQKDIVYVDGFGRPIQKVGWQSSPTKKDVVEIVEYDAYNREPKVYLPYSVTGTGAFRASAKTEQAAFYGANAAANKVATTAYPYSQVSFEASPLNKVLESGNVGEAWQLSTGKTQKTTTRPCEANEVRIWNYNFTDGSISSPGFYVAGDVLATEQRDENGFTSTTYSDKRGLKIMSKRQVSTSDSTITYTVYDAFGNSRAVIQPEGLKELQQTNTWTLNATFINKWCFTYKYDEWQRAVESKRPGAEAVYNIYNKKDQVVLTQDGELRKTVKWMFTKYDALGRTVLTGIYKHSSALTQAQMQALAGNNAGYETYTGENYSVQHGYTVAESFPQLIGANSEILTVNYFDDYDFDRFSVSPGASFIALGRGTDPVPSYRTAGMATGSKKKVLNDTKYLSSVVIYDDKGRVIQTQTGNIFNRNDITTTRTDFAGAVLETVSYHGGSSDEIYIKQNYTYDHRRRLKKTTHQLERDEVVQPTVTISDYDYNELGEVIVKKLHSTDGVNYLQNVDYAYNIRGWLSRINDANLSDVNDLFGMELKYNDGLLSPHNVPARFDGTMAEIWWKDGYSNKKQSYAYRYDNMNRMTSAQYIAAAGSGWTESGGYDESAVYDLNGNIKTLSRYQWTAGARQLGDQLSYTYTGNQLKKVEDNAGAGAAAGFVNGINDPEEYTYDANGSMLLDKNKGITGITNNVLNLAAEIALGTKGKIVYKYDATGLKLSKQVVLPSGATTTTEYVNGFEYLNGVVQFAVTSEGRVMFGTGAPRYEYTLRDHLGNARVNFDRNPATGKARVIQKTDYYPYGLTMPGAYVSGVQNKYQYNGKELQDELGLNQYDYGARMYNPELARWSVVDPLAEKYEDISPYVYVANNPVLYIDPDGRFFKEYENEAEYRRENPNGKLDGSDGHWTRADRRNKSATWKQANRVNLASGRSGDYTTIEQRADFYSWFQGETEDMGFETKWAGAASVVASDVNLMFNTANEMLDLRRPTDFMSFQYLGGAYGTNVLNDIVSFSEEGNRVIFEDVFPKLRTLYSGAPLRGGAAAAWDALALSQEQTLIQPLYESQSNTVRAILSGGAKRSWLMPLSFAGSSPRFPRNLDINNASHRWSYGMSAMGYRGQSVAPAAMPAPGRNYSNGTIYRRLSQ